MLFIRPLTNRMRRPPPSILASEVRFAKPAVQDVRPSATRLHDLPDRLRGDQEETGLALELARINDVKVRHVATITERLWVPVRLKRSLFWQQTLSNCCSHL